jgi:hypothetical protein
MSCCVGTRLFAHDFPSFVGLVGRANKALLAGAKIQMIVHDSADSYYSMIVYDSV